jgi:hypothetical protein
MPRLYNSHVELFTGDRCWKSWWVSVCFIVQGKERPDHNQDVRYRYVCSLYPLPSPDYKYDAILGPGGKYKKCEGRNNVFSFSSFVFFSLSHHLHRSTCIFWFDGTGSILIISIFFARQGLSGPYQMSSKLISGLLQHFEHCFVYLLQRKMMKCRIPDRACAAGRYIWYGPDNPCLAKKILIINIDPVPSNQKIGKPNNLIVFGSSTANGLKQDSKNRQ